MFVIYQVCQRLHFIQKSLAKSYQILESKRFRIKSNIRIKNRKNQTLESKSLESNYFVSKHFESKQFDSKHLESSH